MALHVGRVVGAVFVLSFCGLALEVSLTRVFAVVLRYHFAFFAIALALCGLGLGSYAAHWGMAGSFAERRLRWSVVAFSATTLFALWLLVALLLPRNPNAFWLAGLVTLIPFFFLGVTMATLFGMFAEHSGRLYAADLAGAAAAAFGVVLLLNAFGGLNAVIVLAGLALLSVPLLAAQTALRLTSALVSVALIAFAFLNRGGRYLDLPPVRHADPTIAKPLLQELATGTSRIVATLWNAFCRTDVVRDEGEPDLLHLYTDGEVPALMVRLKSGNLKDGAWLMNTLMGVPYALLLTPRKPDDRPPHIDAVLALGSGGGVDVVCALLAGAKRVDAVDVNPAMKVFAEKFRDFNGRIYERPNVHFRIAEARAFVRQTQRRYDLVVMALTQTATVGKAGLALVESFVHTKDACRDYWRILSRRGLVALITQEPFLALRWWLTCLDIVQEQTGKAPKDAALHLAWWQLPEELWRFSPYRNLVVMARQPFTQSDAAALSQVTKRWNIVPVAVPFVHAEEPLASVLHGAFTADDVVSDVRWRHGVDVRPVTDDAPFFVDLSPTVPPLLWQLIAFAVVLVVGFALIASRAERRKGQQWSILTAFVALLGVGFMLVEVGVLQRVMLLLGSPTHTVALFVGALLLGGAVGSAVSQRWHDDRLSESAQRACAVVAFVAALLGWLVGPLTNALQESSLPLRAVALCLSAFGLGVPMGIPFPVAMRLARNAAVSVPYLWGVNGVMSVTGSVSAVVLGKLMGYSRAIVFGAACYLLAIAMLQLWRRYADR
ncbi:hypothetical protein HRbin17_01838 [bacterium HR17]|uniref:Spermidine synthase n=1 Tax=Candidatus Fervidibacter japonicus TaxID=2035412 RepID=A0A2H5XDR4_9BACT|nr:hypothetical protein HRbin17_01838 [bacterium HR17]